MARRRQPAKVANPPKAARLEDLLPNLKVAPLVHGARGSTVRLDPEQPTREEIPAWFGAGAGGHGTYPEWLTYWALTKLGYKIHGDPRPGLAGEDVIYQDPVLGYYAGEVGSSLIDFVVYKEFPPIALPVQGEFWHPLFGPRYEQDMAIFNRLKHELGWTVIPLDEDDLLVNALYVVRTAVIDRIDLSRYAGRV